MNSIKNEVVIELKINKSVFLNYLIPVSSIDDIYIKMEELKKKYNDANHHCYAYILGENQEVQKFSDDGEPSKTAGLPMIEVLKKHDLTNVLNVSVRYFGGIKLGAGGLVRAYTKGCANSVAEAVFTELKLFDRIKLSISFDLIGHVEKYVRDSFQLDETSYDTNVNYFITLPHDAFDEFNSSINEKTNGKAIIKILDTSKKYI